MARDLIQWERACLMHEALASTPSCTAKKITQFSSRALSKAPGSVPCTADWKQQRDKNPTNNVLSPPIKPLLIYTTTARKLLLQRAGTQTPQMLSPKLDANTDKACLLKGPDRPLQLVFHRLNSLQSQREASVVLKMHKKA